MNILSTKTYYVLDYCIDNKITGRSYPQCQTFLNKVSIHSPKSIYAVDDAIYKKLSFHTQRINLNSTKLARGAKITDFLSTSFAKLPLVNQNVLHSLNKIKINQHRVYPIRVYNRNTSLLYFYIAILPMEQHKYFIWENCRFFETKISFKNENIDSIYEEKINTTIPIFSSFDDYVNYCFPHDEDYRWLNSEEIAVNKDFPMDYDFLTFDCFGLKLVSDNFITEMSKVGLTGLCFDGPIKIVQYE